MDGNERFWIWFWAIVGIVLVSGIAGLTYTSIRHYEHELAMAEAGYVEVSVSLPGQDYPVRMWKKVDLEMTYGQSE